MRPLNLKMCAFGPYKDLVRIDFERLGSSGVFLIAGDTGSGKTTIFDAISFALFGVSSGNRRENSTLRSDFSSDEVKTFVELEFIHKNVLYKVERVPRYNRKKIRGNGTTAVGGDATLTYLDEVVTGDKNVSDKCVEILGINANQFKQIVMIAQGEFLELLLAKPKDRAIIFRKIFDTGIYKDISDRLKTKYLDKKREYEDVIVTLGNYKNSIIWDRDIAEDDSCSFLLEQLNSYNEEVKREEEKLKEEKVRLDKEYELVVQKISEGNLINDSIKNLEEVKKELEILNDDKANYLDKEVILKQNKDIVEYVLPNYQEVKRLEKGLDAKRKDYNDNLRLVNDISLKYEEVNARYKELNKLEERLDELKNKKVLYDNKLINLQEIDTLKSELWDKKKILELIDVEVKKGIVDKFKELNDLNDKLGKLEVEFSNLKTQYQDKNNYYVECYEEFLNAQAGILASNLKDNDPCPVCGSLHHPKLAVMKDTVLTKEDIDSLKNELDNISSSLERKAIDINGIRKDIEVYKGELSNYNYEVLIKEISDIDNKYIDTDIDVSKYIGEDIEREVINIESLINDKSKDLDKEDNVDIVNQELDKLSIDIDQLLNEINEVKDSYQALKIEKEKYKAISLNLESEIKELEEDLKCCYGKYVSSYKELGYDNEGDYLSIKMEREELSRLEREIALYKERLVELRGKASSLEKFLDGKISFDIDNLLMKKVELEDNIKDKDVSLKEINHKLVNNLNVCSNINTVYEKSKNLEKEVMICKDLSDTANGNISGKNKLEFEQFVQASYFDRVVVAANKRFSYMTDERYLLARKEEALKISDKLGLELEVIDNYTGKRRDVKTLSGGESFKASLSLALGMSDTIQEFSGGIVVDAMFIDEGFGSLDDDSLEAAMNAIMMLGQNNKIIGIISHVNELKARIDKKIIVRKSNSGSRIEISI
ncbi:MAG: SMC family ATPase [Bacilli bacterium]|nr:SMC family ATPase [Bacilli bacterium]